MTIDSLSSLLFFDKKASAFARSGNKYRKLYTLLQTPKQNLKKIISYGGSQSNAMLAIARMCELKSWEFIYYTKPLSNKQKEENLGNYIL